MLFPNSLDSGSIPSHIAIIMDGNGRWALKRKMLRTIGHKVGVESVQNIVKTCCKLNVSVLTLYAFSSENWQRPAVEVKTLMSLLKSYLSKELNNLKNNNIKLRCIGEKEKLPTDVAKILDDSIDDTSSNSGMILNLALSYGSRGEIIRAVKKVAALCKKGALDINNIDEKLFSDKLYTQGLPDPDLIIRTGGESRLSNFLLWQASYSEIYITDTHWPDFREPDLIQAINDYQGRQRRFGKTGIQVEQQ